MPLYKSLVRSRLEYCVQAWQPYLVKDIELMEKVQKRMTRMLPDLKNMSYPEILKILGLTTLESRRLRDDLIEVFNVVKGFDNIDGNIFFFHRDIGVCRGHSEKLHKHTFNLDVRKFKKKSFSQRVINHWNALTQHAVDCDTVNSFKRCVDHYIRDKGY